MRISVTFIIAILCTVCIADRAHPEVYLNRQWSESLNDWVTKGLVLEGASLYVDRSYQNAYGEFFGYPPGPPFYVEDRITIVSMLQAGAMGSLTFQAGGSGGGADFEIVFVETVGHDTEITVYGPVQCLGVPGDPIIFKGPFNFWALGYNPEVQEYTCTFEYCKFENPVYSSIGSAGGLIEFNGCHAVIENCTFKNAADPFPFIILSYDDLFRDQWNFEMRGCLFENNNMPDWGYAPVWFDYLGTVTLEDNNFVNNHFIGHADCGVVRMEKGHIGRIAGNRGHGNTSDCIQIREYTFIFEGEDAYLESSADFPLIINEIHLPAGASLEIADGSLLKLYHNLSTYTNFYIGGELVIDGALFTSWEDDSLGGDTDFKPQPVHPMRWGSAAIGRGGITVEPGGSAVIRNSTFLYAKRTLFAGNDVLIDNCDFRYNENGFLSFNGYADNTFTVRNSTFEYSSGNEAGISLDNEGGAGHTLILDNCSVLQCAEGLNLRCLAATPADITVTGCTIAGNRTYGIFASPGPGLNVLRIERSIVSANYYDGIYGWYGGTAGPVIRIESCVMAGNGWIGNYSAQSSGANIQSGTLHFVNNSSLLNRGHGLRQTVGGTGTESVVNNILAWNKIYGYSKDENDHPVFAYNCVWGNENREVYFRTPGGVLLTVEEIQALGGDFATNMHIEPQLLPGASGEAAAVSYDDMTKHSFIVAAGNPFEEGRLKGKIVNPNISQDDWYIVIGNTEDTLVVAGDVSAVASAGDTFKVFDHHLAAGSNMTDTGRNAEVQAALDIDGEHRIIDGNEDMLTIVDIGADEFNPDSFSIFVLSPKANDQLIPGEEYEVRWSAVGIDAVDVVYAAHYDPVGTNVWEEVALNVPGSDGKYTWTVPDTLSTRCMIEVSDSENEAHLALSGLFRIKGYRLARLDTEGEYEPFMPGTDDWRFANEEANMWPESWWSRFDYENGTDPYTGEPYPYFFSSHAWTFAKSSDFPDWPLFVHTFGVEQCYFDSPAGLMYRPSAVTKWTGIKEEWGGSCFGFAVSGLLAFDDRDAFRAAYPGVEPFDSLYGLQLTDDHRMTVNRIYLLQHGKGFYDRIAGSLGKSPNETLDEVKQMLLADVRSDRWLLAEDKNGSGAHALCPYKVLKDPQNQDIEYVYVYDSNHPNDAGTRIVIDTDADTWEYDKLPGWGSDTLLALGDTVGNYITIPVLEETFKTGGGVFGAPSSGGVPGAPLGGGVFGAPSNRGVPGAPLSSGVFSAPSSGGAFGTLSNGGTYELYATPGVFVTISDGSGHTIGFADSAVFGDMPGGISIIPIAGGYHPPVGYVVPAGHYRIEMHGFPDTLAVLSVFEDSIIYTYARTDAAPSQVDVISCGDMLSIRNEDGSEKSFNAEVIAAGKDEEKVYEIFDCGLAQGDSMSLMPLGSDSLEVANHGQEKIYKLGLRLASTSSNGVFEHADIAIAPVSSHVVIPQWGDIASTLVKILIDIGNDGTIDDSIFVDNEFVATLLRDYDVDFRGEFVEITWRLFAMDEDIEFVVLRSGGGDQPFEILDGLIIERDDLTFRVVDHAIERGRKYRYRVEYIVNGRNHALFETMPVGTPPLPLTLFQNYPNPFNPATKIRYYLPEETYVTVDIHDVAGRRIVRLEGERRKPGYHVLSWDGRNEAGHPVGSGIYLYRIQAGKKSIAKKMVILR